MIGKCPECGKEFEVLWPVLWKYRRGGTYYCSWHCYNREEREMKMRRQIAKEIKEEAIRIALAGGDPKKYLKQNGCGDAVQAWYKIKVKLKQEDPDTYYTLTNRNTAGEKVPALKVSGPLRIEAEEPEKVELVYDESIAEEYRREQAEKAAEEKEAAEKAAEEPEEDDMQVTGVYLKEFGEFRYIRRFNEVEWTSLEGDEVGLGPLGWRNLIEAIPKILKKLGVWNG